MCEIGVVCTQTRLCPAVLFHDFVCVLGGTRFPNVSQDRTLKHWGVFSPQLFVWVSFFLSSFCSCFVTHLCSPVRFHPSITISDPCSSPQHLSATKTWSCCSNSMYKSSRNLFHCWVPESNKGLSTYICSLVELMMCDENKGEDPGVPYATEQKVHVCDDWKSPVSQFYLWSIQARRSVSSIRNNPLCVVQLDQNDQ